MHALIVVAHHDPQSLTHSVAAEVGAGLTASGHTFE
ncbi:flavodoxin family protein, partial [Pseudomonas carnis]